jgi:16S rRNA (guanine527-N7)-methyltransferase
MKALQDSLKKGAKELGIEISAQQLTNFTLYAEELCKWNCRINLTTIIDPEEIAIKHFLDSIVLAKYMDITGIWLDVGSGGGFPGIPLSIMFRETSFVSVDSVEKKIHFQRHIARTLALTGFTALHNRVEKLVPEYTTTFTRIVSRAFADIPCFVKYALPLLAEGGVMVAMKGRDGRKEAAVATDALQQLGTAVTAVHEFELPLLKDPRSLIVISRIIS